MKIVHVITRLILGGAQENTILTCEGLHARGHEVTLVTGPPIGPEGELVTRARAGGYRLVVLDEMRREIHPARDLATYRSLKKLLAELAPDVMHSHSSKAGILARKAAAAVGGIKVVHTIHGLPFHPYQSWWKNRAYVALERRAANRTDAIISVADAMTRQALAAGVGRPAQYATVYSGMETQAFTRPDPRARKWRKTMGLTGDAILVTQVSRLAELKGHEYIVEAATRIADPRVHFCFVGEGHRRRRIETQIRAAGLASRFHLAGLAPPDEVGALLQASDIVIHCSLREGLARVLPQAMLAGRPVVSFDVDGANEVVDSDTGILLQPRDVSGLVLAIQTLAASPQLREQLGQAGKVRCLAMFDHDLMVRKIQAIYEGLMSPITPANTSRFTSANDDTIRSAPPRSAGS
jgi:glycosyltransferase involved in cell wall biosynthesis